MARGIRELRRRIQSVRNTEQITKAMKMVSAAKLRKAEGAVLAARPYTDKVSEVVGRVASQLKNVQHPLLTKREEGTTGIILITADRGLCGAFNGNLIRRGAEVYKNNPGSNFILVGRKGKEFFRRTVVSVQGEFLNLGDAISYDSAQAIANKVYELYESGTWNEVKLVYASHRSTINYDVVVKDILPFQPQTAEDSQGRAEYVFEPSAEVVLGDLLPRYVETVIYRALLENKASEQGARMAAMDNASRNAADMIKRLTLYMNRVRQAAITSEIAEIVGGAEAMK